MLQLESLELVGFKSFAGKTKTVFPERITAIIGPNGCGKSNIVDALRWTLGEASAKALRGSAMEDVIFNGSETRGPKSMAEVTITFDNTDGLSHSSYMDFTEISVTRRLHRDGQSEYLINKVPCRRRDITDLFLGTGGGALAALNLGLERPDLVGRIVADSLPGECSRLRYVERTLESRERGRNNLLNRLFWRSMHGKDWKTVVDQDSAALLRHHNEIGTYFHKL